MLPSLEDMTLSTSLQRTFINKTTSETEMNVDEEHMHLKRQALLFRANSFVTSIRTIRALDSDFFYVTVLQKSFVNYH